MMNQYGTFALRIGLALLLLAGASAGWADKILTNSGQTLEGVIRDENPYNVKLDVRGSIVAVPRDRIKSIVRFKAEENVQMLMEHAMESLSRSDATQAHAYIDQARTMTITDPAILDDIDKLTRQIQEMEIRGGSLAERQLRAQSLLQRAKEAYNLIRNEEGNTLLLQALQTDPDSEEAHTKINELLSKSSPDLLLAADYFVKVMWPDHIRADSPAIKLLPKVYVHLASLYADSIDPVRASHYAQLMKKFSEAFAAHPAWKETTDEKIKAALDQPVETLVAGMISASVDKKNYDLALKKMQGLMDPTSSMEIGTLYVRALVGAGKYTDAITALDKVKTKFPSETSLPTQLNALRMLDEGLKMSDQKAAIPNFETIYGTRQNLVPEIGEMVGHTLARLKGPDMDPALASRNPARAADIAAIVMQFGDDPAMRRHAAQIIVQNLQNLPWRMELVWKINGAPLPVPESITQLASEKLAQPLMVRFDQASPFTIRLTIDAATAGDAGEIVQALSSGLSVSKPAIITDFGFTLEATQQSLGTFYRSTWRAADVPQAAVPLSAAPLTTPTPAATPAPGATPVKTPAATPTPAAAPAATPAPVAAPAANLEPIPGIPLPPGGSGGGAVRRSFGNLLEIRSQDSIRAFVERGLDKYVWAWPAVTMLPSHLSVPKAQEIMKGE